MKKISFIIGIVLLVLFVIFGPLYVVDHRKMDNNEAVVFSTWGKKYSPVVEVSPQIAIENVKKMFDEKSIESTTNFDNPKIEEVVFDSKRSMRYFEEDFDIVGKKLYKITFNTKDDAFLGPAVFYVDKSSGKVIGSDFRL